MKLNTVLFMKNMKGSQSAMIELINSDDFLDKLKEIVDDDSIEFSKNEKFKPISKEKPKEGELKDFLINTEWSELANNIGNWWLGIQKANLRTPNWDFISTCTINGKKGLLLIEAKAHWNELTNDHCSSNSKNNREKIETAINQAKDDINNKNIVPPISISIDNYYQLSNRIAHSWWLASQGVPVILLYLGFLNCSDMQDNVKVFTSDLDWKNCFNQYSSKVGIDNLIGKSIDCNKSEFKLICRSY